MICLNHESFLYFLQVTGLDVVKDGLFFKVLSEYPALYVWTGEAFCTGGIVA